VRVRVLLLSARVLLVSSLKKDSTSRLEMNQSPCGLLLVLSV
jgi:hypothetical protein